MCLLSLHFYILVTGGGFFYWWLEVPAPGNILVCVAFVKPLLLSVQEVGKPNVCLFVFSCHTCDHGDSESHTAVTAASRMGGLHPGMPPTFPPYTVIQPL